jgi:hypothetical protein
MGISARGRRIWAYRAQSRWRRAMELRARTFRSDLGASPSRSRGNSANLLRSRMPWSREFNVPIALKDGRSITTLGQGRALMLNLPVRHQVRPYWQYAAELLLIASENKGALERAHAQLSRALMIEGLL